MRILPEQYENTARKERYIFSPETADSSSSDCLQNLVLETDPLWETCPVLPCPCSIFCSLSLAQE